MLGLGLRPRCKVASRQRSVTITQVPQNVTNGSDFEPRIILKLLLYLRENIPIFVDALLHFKYKQDFIFYIDNTKVHLKAVI